MEAFVLILILVGMYFLFFRKKKKPDQIVPTAEDKVLFVGRVSELNFEGLNGGNKIMLFEELPEKCQMEMLKSDGSIQGDVNMLYSHLKKGLGDVVTDEIAYQHLDAYFSPMSITPLSEECSIHSDAVEKQRDLAARCK